MKEYEALIKELQTDAEKQHSLLHVCDSTMNALKAANAITTLTAENASLKKQLDELKEANRWVPCSEKMPEENHYVNAYAPIFNNVFECFVGKDGLWRFVDSCRHITQPITHWRPLPSAPEQEG